MAVIDDLVYKFGIDDSDVKKGAKRIESTVSKIGQFASGLTGALAMPLGITGGIEAAGELIGQAGRAIFEFSKEASALEAVETSFYNLAKSAGMSGSSILEAMGEATEGLLTDYQRMTFANKTLMAGLELTPDQFKDMMLIARGAAQSTGESFDYMASSIIEALSKQEREILDNLGIIVDANEAYANHAQAIDVDVKAMTQAQKVQGWVNSALAKGTDNLERMGGVQTTSAEKFQSMSVAMEETKIALGKLFTPAVTGILGEFTEGVSSLAEGLAELPPLFESASDKAQRLKQDYADLKEETDTQVETIKTLQDKYNDLHKKLDDENISLDESKRLNGELNTVVGKLTKSVPGLSSVMSKYGDDVDEVNKYLQRNVEIQQTLLRTQQKETARAMRKAYTEAEQQAQSFSKTTKDLSDDVAFLTQLTEEQWQQQKGTGELIGKITNKTNKMLPSLIATYGNYTAAVSHLGIMLEEAEKKSDRLSASTKLAGKDLVTWIKSADMGEALDQFAELAKYDVRGYTKQQEKAMDDLRAKIRSTFQLSMEEVDPFINRLIQINEIQKEAPKPKPTVTTTGGGITAIGDDETKAALDSMKNAMDDYARHQRSVSSGIWKANVDDLQKMKQATLAKLTEETGLTEDAVMAEMDLYSELADFLLDLDDKILAKRQEVAEESLKTELDNIDELKENEVISFQESIDRLDKLAQAETQKANTDQKSLDLIDKKRTQIEKRHERAEKKAFDKFIADREAEIQVEEEQAEKVKAIRSALQVFEDKAAEATSFTQIEQYQARLKAFVDTNQQEISGHQELQTAVQATTANLDMQKDDLADIHFENLKIQSDIKTQEAFEQSAAQTRAQNAEDEANRQAFLVSQQQKRIDLGVELMNFEQQSAQATSQSQIQAIQERLDAFINANEVMLEGTEGFGIMLENIQNLLDQQSDTLEDAEIARNKFRMQGNTPWGTLQNIGTLKKQIGDLEKSGEKYTDKWMNSVKAVEGQYSQLFGMARAGLDAMGVDLGETGEAALGFAESLMTAGTNPFGAILSGFNLITTLFKTTERERKKLEDIEIDVEIDDENALKTLGELQESIANLQEDEINRQKQVNRLKEEYLESVRKENEMHIEGPSDERQEASRNLGLAKQDLEATEDQIRKSRHEYNKLLREQFREPLRDMMKSSWESIFDPENVSDPLEDFNKNLDRMIRGLVKDFVIGQSFVQSYMTEYGASLSAAMADGVITGSEKIELDKARQNIEDAYSQSTAEFEKLGKELGLDTGEALNDGFEETFIDDFASGLSGNITNTIRQSIEENDIKNLGADLAENFASSFSSVVTDKMIHLAGIQPALEHYAGLAYEFLADESINVTEASILQKEQEAIVRLGENARENISTVLDQLGMEFEQEEKDAAEQLKTDTEETEAFQTISNITHYQGNAIVSQLTAHSRHLALIANTNQQIVEINQMIAENTQSLNQMKKVTINETVETNNDTLASQAQGLVARIN